jgi:hypothetical protein
MPFKVGDLLELAIVEHPEIGFIEVGDRFPVLVGDIDLNKLEGDGNFMLEGLLELDSLLGSQVWVRGGFYNEACAHKEKEFCESFSFPHKSPLKSPNFYMIASFYYNVVQLNKILPGKGISPNPYANKCSIKCAKK